MSGTRPTIGVHNGPFHADDIISVYFLRQTEEFHGAKVVRTRDSAILDACECVIDVGGVYDHEKRRYDHHQPTIDEKFPGSPVPMASAGLVYRHFGREVIRNILTKNLVKVNDEQLEFIYESLYMQFVQEVDAADNGFSPVPEGSKPRYKVNTDISHRIGTKNPHWKSVGVDVDRVFLEAVEYVGAEFEYLVDRTARYGLEEFEMMKTGFEKRLELDDSGAIMEIPKFFMYGQFLKKVEGDETHILLIIHPREDQTWSVRAVGTGRGFELRKKMPFAGMPAKEVSERSGVPGVIYSHKRAFITILDTREHAVMFAKFAIAQSE